MTDYINYDHAKFVYETPIRRYEQDALAKATQQAIERCQRNHERFGIKAEGYAFRVVCNRYASSSGYDDDDWVISSQLEIIAFPIIKRTPTGFRIWRGHNGRFDETRLVSRLWTKTWASDTPEGALRDFAARKKRQASIHDARAKNARHEEREALALLEKDALAPFAA